VAEDVEINAIAVVIKCRDSTLRDVRIGLKFNISRNSDYLYIHRSAIERAVEMLRKCVGVSVDVEQLWG